MRIFNGILACLAVTALQVGGMSANAQEFVNAAEVLPPADLPLTVQQWVVPDETGVFRGTVNVATNGGQMVPVPGAKVVLTDVTGASVSTKAAADGTFGFGGVAPGIYSFTTTSEGTFACFALHVLNRGNAATRVYPTSLDVMSASIEAGELQQMISRYAPPMSSPHAYRISEDSLAAMAGRLINRSRYQVAQSGGGIVGRIFNCGLNGSELYPTSLVNVMLYKNGSLQTRVVSDNNGVFRIPSIEPGFYSILAIGKDGIGATALELLASPSTVLNQPVSSTGQTFVATNALQGGAPTAFAMQISPMSQAMAGMPISRDSDDDGFLPGAVAGAPGVPGAPVPGGGFGGGGGGFGGGGGGFGGGGGGGLGGLGSLAGLAALAAINDDNNGGGGGNALFPPQPASPAEPSL